MAYAQAGLLGFRCRRSWKPNGMPVLPACWRMLADWRRRRIEVGNLLIPNAANQLFTHIELFVLLPVHGIYGRACRRAIGPTAILIVAAGVPTCTGGGSSWAACGDVVTMRLFSGRRKPTWCATGEAREFRNPTVRNKTQNTKRPRVAHHRRPRFHSSHGI